MLPFTILHNAMEPGLYVVHRQTLLKQHVGILVVGNGFGLFRPTDLFQYRDGVPPIGVLVHFNPAGLQREIVYELGEWVVDRRVSDNDGQASLRLRDLLTANPSYDLVLRNCEHAVSFVETGKSESPQVRGWSAVAGLVGLIALLG